MIATGGAAPAWVQWLVGLALLGGVLFLAARSNQKREAARDSIRSRLDAALTQVRATAHFDIGEHVAGLPGSPGQAVCAVTPEELVFIGMSPGDPEDAAPVLGRIPRNSVDAVLVKDESQTHTHTQTLQRLSVTRLALLGPLALAAPKRRTVQTTVEAPKFFLIVDWTNANGVREEALFRFDFAEFANSAATNLKTNLKPR